MKRILIILIISVFLSGCYSQSTSLDTSSANYNASYNLLSHSTQVMKTISPDKNGLFYIRALTQYKKADGRYPKMLCYYNFENQKSVVINTQTNIDSIGKDFEKSSGFLGYDEYQYLNLYNNHLYYIVSETDTIENITTYHLFETKLDGTARKNVFDFKIKSDFSSLSLTFHQGYLYIVKSDEATVKKINILDWKEEDYLQCLQNAKDPMLYFIDDELYAQTSFFKKDNQSYYNVWLKIDIRNDEAAVLYEGHILKIMSKDYGVIQEEKELYYYNLTTKEKKLISDGYNWVFGTNKYFITKKSDESKLILFDNKGKKLDELMSKYEMDFIPQGIINNEYYIYLKDKKQNYKSFLVRIKINSDSFGDIELLDNFSPNKEALR